MEPAKEKKPCRTERVMVQLTPDDREWLHGQAVKTVRSHSGVIVELIRAAREGRKPSLADVL